MSKISKEKAELLLSLKDETTEFNLTDTIPNPWMISTKSESNAKKYDDTMVIYYNFRTGKYYVYSITDKTLKLIPSSGGTRRRSRKIKRRTV